MENNDVKKNTVADLIMSLLLIVSGGLIIVTGLRMKVFNTFLDAPGFFPVIVGAIFILLGTLMFTTAIKRKAFSQVPVVFNKENMKRFVTNDQFIRVMILMGMMIVYIFVLIGRVHFTIATSVYLFATFFYLKSTSIVKMLIISIVTGILISTVFSRAFYIPLP